MASKKTRQITHHPISAIIPYERNNKIHSPEQINHIANSIAEFGFNQPIVVDENNIVLVGHGRLLAAQKMGLEEVPTICIADLTEAQKKAYRIIDNKVSADAPWDFEAVQSEMVALTEMDFDMSKFMDAFDFPDQEVRIEVSEDDSSAVLEDDPIVKSGDIIHLGEHRIICGDSTDAKVFLAAHQGESMDLVITDPPYGVSYTGRTEEALTIDNDDLDEGALSALWIAVVDNLLSCLKEGGSFYATVPAGPLRSVFSDVLKSNHILRQELIWHKNSLVMGHSDYHYKHEPILYGWKPGAAHYFTADRSKTDVLDFDRPSRSTDHPTMKPIKLWAELIQNSSKAGDFVIDPFLGSGTTLIACEMLSRKCRGIELSPKYAQVCIRRWCDYRKARNLPNSVDINGEILSAESFIASEPISEI